MHIFNQILNYQSKVWETGAIICYCDGKLRNAVFLIVQISFTPLLFTLFRRFEVSAYCSNFAAEAVNPKGRDRLHISHYVCELPQKTPLPTRRGTSYARPQQPWNCWKGTGTGVTGSASAGSSAIPPQRPLPLSQAARFLCAN